MTDSTTSTLLRNVRAVLPHRVSERTNIFIQNGLISRVADSDPDEGSGAPAYERASDSPSTFGLEGLTLYPGFIDVHIHGAIGVDTMAADASDLNRVSGFLAAQGVTSWLPTLVPAPHADYSQAVIAINGAMNNQIGARILGVHYEGPFVNSAQCGALRSEYFKTYAAPDDLDALPLPSGEAARMITLAPEVAGGVELVRELSRRGWVVSIGHTRAGFELLDLAFDAGARHMTHFMNAMAPLHHRSPGPIAWGLSRDDVTCDVIADGIHLDPHMLQLLLKLKGAERLTLISDAIAAAGQGDGDYQIWGETITVKDSRTSNARGNIAGSVITMLDAVRLMISLGVTEVGVAGIAATNPARLLRLDQECGSIEEGKRADLVALDAQGNAVLTLIGGEVAFRKQ
ncbi:MAG: N-acetylglucosamine-6-phosphate deacetylase [Pyrinomonadaceae bacterium]|nr:N-acetylglucosamine-6-phosphate deacetylase [Pyrinomonadaceae bacterium]